jgi:hypothetical protein
MPTHRKMQRSKDWRRFRDALQAALLTKATVAQKKRRGHSATAL